MLTHKMCKVTVLAVVVMNFCKTSDHARTARIQGSFQTWNKVSFQPHGLLCRWYRGGVILGHPDIQTFRFGQPNVKHSEIWTSHSRASMADWLDSGISGPLYDARQVCDYPYVQFVQLM